MPAIIPDPYCNRTTPRLSVLIADDDPIQLRHLSALVRRLRPEWDVVSELTSLEQIRNEVDRLNPSLLVLDAQFKHASAIDLVRELPEGYPVIFAADEGAHAVDAFACSALDFILKPISESRFEQALRKAENSISCNRPVIGHQPRRTASSLKMYRANELVWVPINDVNYFQAERKYTRVILKDYEGLLGTGISSIIPNLNSDFFLRIHRSIILNISQMAFAKRDNFNRLTITLKNRKEKLIVAKPHEKLFKDGFS